MTITRPMPGASRPRIGVVQKAPSLFDGAQLIPRSVGADKLSTSLVDPFSEVITTDRLGSGPPSAATFLRGDSTWAAPQAFPVGALFIAVVSTNPATLLGYGTWTAFGAGRVLVGVDSGDADFDTVEETGGAKTVAAAGSVAAPTISGSTAAEAAHTHSVTSNVTVADHASHTHTYTDVLKHTHTVTVTDPGHSHTIPVNTNSWTAFGSSDIADSNRTTNATESTNSNTTGITATTADPAGGVTTGTTAGPSATLTHTPTNNAVTSGAGASHLHAAGTLAASAPGFTGTATSVVQPYITCYFWKRTA